MAGSNIVKMTPLDLFRQGGGGSAEVKYPIYCVNVMDYGVWAEGALYRNVADDGTITYDPTPNEARKAVTGFDHHDDTPGIQAAINEAAVHGGCVYFPMHATPDVKDEEHPELKHRFERYYRLDSPAKAYYNPDTMEPTDEATRTKDEETVANYDLRAQLAIPPKSNVYMLGEVPPPSLRHYHVVTDGNNNFGPTDQDETPIQSRCVVLRSSVDAPSNVSYEDRPWSVIAAPSGEKKTNMRVDSSSEAFFMKNIEVRAHIEMIGAAKPKLYPTMGAVNLMNVRRMHIEDCFFGLDNDIGSNYVGEGFSGKGRCLQKSPTTTVGLFGAIEDCAEHKLIHVTVQGFKFGMVLPEMTNANFIHISNTEYALCFIDCTHASLINHLSTHNNRRCICVLPIKEPAYNGQGVWEFPKVFGCTIYYPEWDVTNDLLYNPEYKPAVHVRILEHDYETGHFVKPLVSQMRFGVWDPQDRLHGTIVYHQGFPGDANASRNFNDAFHGTEWQEYSETPDGSGSATIGGVTVSPIAGGRSEDVNRQLERTARMYTLDHCMYDHREGGESAALFTSDGNVDDWITADWTEEPYDFIAYHSSRIDQNGNVTCGRIAFTNVDDKDIVGAECFFKSRNALPPCPVLNGTRYTPPDHGDYFPVLGASAVVMVPLRNTRKEGSYPFVELVPKTDESPVWAFSDLPDGYEIKCGAWRSASGKSNSWTFFVKGGNGEYKNGKWYYVATGSADGKYATQLTFSIDGNSVTATRASSLSCRLQDRVVNRIDCDGKGTFYVVLPPQSTQGARDFKLRLDNVSGMASGAQILYSVASSFEQAPTLSSTPSTSGTWHFVETAPNVFTVFDPAQFADKYEKPSGGIPASDLAQAVQTALAAISGKADAADLRYRIADAGFRYQFAASAFPITYMNTITSTPVTITAGDADDITWEVQPDGSAYVSYNGFDFAYFSSTGDYGGSQPGVDLQFNGVAAANAGEPLVQIQILADRTVNLVTATDETSIDIELPAAVTVDGVRHARDFILDVDNSANASDLALEFTGLNVDYAFVPLEDDSVGEMVSIGAGERVRLYFTETPYHATGSLPVIQIARCTLGDFVTSTTPATQGGN